MKTKLGVIGCGKMGTALVKGALAAGALADWELAGFDVHAGAMQAFAEATGALSQTLDEIVADSSVLLLSTKPQEIIHVISQIPRDSKCLVISIAAGVPIPKMQAVAPDGVRLVRVMPNTPALVGQGASAYCCSEKVSSADKASVEKLLGAVGLVMEVPEYQMNAVTGLSGSGPAYACLLIEGLADGGVKNGLSREMALKLAAQTLLGTAQMVLSTGLHPAVLRDQVTSPAGTTAAGLAALEAHAVRAALIDAVSAATERANELG